MTSPVSKTVVIGVTGHQNLSPEIETYVRDQIDIIIQSCGFIEGISSLASGADQIFASCVLSRKNDLTVVVPASDYRDTFNTTSDLGSYDRLLSEASKVIALPYLHSSEDAYLAAGELVVLSCDRLLAVWDGQPARGKGGTADIVQIATDHNKEVTIIWPKGQKRP